MNLLEKGIEIKFMKGRLLNGVFLFNWVNRIWIYFDADSVRGLIRVAHVMCRDIEVTEMGLYGSERRFKRV